MKFGVYPTLNKQYILDRISQEDIMTKYLGIPVEFNKLLLSPLRTDNNPTCAFYYNENNKLRFRDLGGHFWGDCFDVVAYRLKVDAKSKKGFHYILHTIAKDFRIHKYQDINEVNNYNKIIEKFTTNKRKKEKVIFTIVFREFNYHDDTYWNKFNINRNILAHGKVYAAREIYMNKGNSKTICLYKYSTKDPAYCYYGGIGTYNIPDWKIYYPMRKKKGEIRFHSNSSFLQGKHLITGDKVGLITKSFKDVLSFRSFGIQSVAPSAESILLTQPDFEFMQDNFDIIYSCMDYDRAGMIMAKKLRDTYDIEPIMFTNGYNNSIDYGAKDFAEYVDNFGKIKTQELLNKIYNKIKHKL